MKLRSPIPELTGATLWLNKEVSRSDLIGEKPTLFHFWSVSCQLCDETMEDVQTILDQYKERLNVVSVHMPLTENDTDLTNIEQAASKLGISQPIYIDNDLKLSNEFENQYVPAYYIFDQSGVLRHYQAGNSGLKILQNRLDYLLD